MEEVGDLEEVVEEAMLLVVAGVEVKKKNQFGLVLKDHYILFDTLHIFQYFF